MSKTIATFTRPPLEEEQKGEEQCDGVFRIHVEELHDILMKPEVKDLPVCVYSIVGPYRSGKSFLMNYFIRYLEARERGSHLDCPFGESSKKLDGFPWESEAEPVTEEINMWHRPFVIRRNSDNEKVAVILVDSQGMNDSRLEKIEETLLFAVNCIISKTLIYNIKEKIEEDDLRALASAVKAVTFEERAEFFNEMELLILVRDWHFKDLPPGLSGGKDYLDAKLKSIGKYQKEGQHTRDILRCAFKGMQCDFLPFIGMRAFEAEEGFEGALNDLCKKFVGHLEKLANHLFSDVFLQPKPMAGRPMTCEDVCTTLKVFLENLLFGESLTINKAFEEACCEKVAREYLEKYKQHMAKEDAKRRPCLEKEEFDQKHEEIKKLTFSNVEGNLSQVYLDYAARKIDKLSYYYSRQSDANSMDKRVRGDALANAEYDEHMEQVNVAAKVAGEIGSFASAVSVMVKGLRWAFRRY